MYIAADELGAFVHKYDDEMIAGLSAFYDPDPYSQNRRTKELKIAIKSPQLNLLAGSTPSNLMKFMPEGAWDQGFTSRLIMVFSDERIIGDDFAATTSAHSPNLAHDIGIINGLTGQFQVTGDYRECVNNWRALGEPPIPNHPKLVHYITRRRAHLYKLSMISAIDRSNALVLTRDDFNRAMNWLVEAETYMPEIFKAGTQGADGAVMDEIIHLVRAAGPKGLHESKITRFASQRIPIHSVMRVIEVLERSGQIRVLSTDPRTNYKTFTAYEKSSETPLQ